MIRGPPGFFSSHFCTGWCDGSISHRPSLSRVGGGQQRNCVLKQLELYLSSSFSSTSSSLHLDRKRNLFQLLYVRRQNQVAGSLLFPSLHFHFHHLHSLFMNHEQTTTGQNHSKITVKPAGTILSSLSEPPSERKSFSSFHMLNSKTRLLPELSFSHHCSSIWIICTSSL